VKSCFCQSSGLIFALYLRVTNNDSRIIAREMNSLTTRFESGNPIKGRNREDIHRNYPQSLLADGVITRLSVEVLSSNAVCFAARIILVVFKITNSFIYSTFSDCSSNHLRDHDCASFDPIHPRSKTVGELIFVLKSSEKCDTPRSFTSFSSWMTFFA
jgi:hypothetical protein